MLRTRLVVLALLAVAPAAAQADGFDRLRQAVERLPDRLGTSTGLLFEFMSPAAQAGWDLRDKVAVSAAALRAPLARPAAAIGLTGIAFPGLDVLMVFGDPPREVAYLAGPMLQPLPVLAALRARDFAEATEDGVHLLSLGEEDFAVDIRSFDRNDPFGAGLGRSQRVAVADGAVIAAGGWEPLRAALPMLDPGAPPTALGHLLAELAAAAAAEAGEGMEVAAAMGFTSEPFRDPEHRPASADTAEPIRFELGMFIASELREGPSTAQIVLAFADRDAAGAGTAEVARRLADWPPMAVMQREGVTRATSVLTDGDRAIGVITVRLPWVPESARRLPGRHMGAALYRRWFEGVMRRQFAPLGGLTPARNPAPSR